MVERFEFRRDRKVMDWLACDEHTIQFRKRSLDLDSLFSGLL
jgi:hypothetical protein